MITTTTTPYICKTIDSRYKGENKQIIKKDKQDKQTNRTNRQTDKQTNRQTMWQKIRGKIQIKLSTQTYI